MNPELTFFVVPCFIPAMAAASDSLNGLLKATSRSFYLTLRVLPAAIRPQVGLAYLLARTTDTIADTEILPVEQRLAALQELRQRILGKSSAPLNFGEMAGRQEIPAERHLLEKVEAGLAELDQLAPADRLRVRDVLATITSGQELDLQRFHGASAENIVALATEGELDDYTYRVAGCVGEFWTQMCRAHLFPRARLDEREFIADGIRFGKGLQLINILRDLPADFKKGRCYLPLERLETAHLRPEVVLSPANEAKFLPLFHRYLDAAEAHLAAGWCYTNTLPFSEFRVRLACAWPILIGLQTIKQLRVAKVADLKSRVKVSRGEVRRILFISLLASPVPWAWRKLYSSAGKAVAPGGDLA